MIGMAVRPEAPVRVRPDRLTGGAWGHRESAGQPRLITFRAEARRADNTILKLNR
jgi:hypothetical protein